MEPFNPPSDAEYEVVALAGGKWGVRVTSPAGLPQLVEGFDSEAEAEAWVFEQTEAGAPDEGLPPHI